MKRLYFGYDERTLYVRLESHASLDGYVVDAYVRHLGAAVEADADQRAPHKAEVRPLVGSASREIAIRPDRQSAELSQWKEDTGWVRVAGDIRIAADDTVLEAAASFDVLGTVLGDQIGLSVVLFKDGLVVQRLPEEGEIIVQLAQAAETQAVPV